MVGGDVFGFFGSFVSDDFCSTAIPEVVDIWVIFVAAGVVVVVGFRRMTHGIHFLWGVTRRWS